MAEAEITGLQKLSCDTVADRMRIGQRDFFWLLLAVLVHALLLFIPLRFFQAEEPASRVISVTLLEPPEKQTLAEKLPPPLPAPEAEPENEVAQQLPAPRPEIVQPVEQVLAEELQEEPPATVSAARLIDSLRRLEGLLPENNSTRQLGVFVPQPVPDNWRPGIVVEDNRFNGMVVPEKIEIVDRWLAADGSHNVVVNTPTGQTLCGRAQAWNPMNPLVEHVMMFRPCGGGGKRTFKMPDRFNKSR